MNKELKAIAMLFPQVFDGEELLPDEFMDEAEAVQKELLSKISFVKIFLESIGPIENKFSDYDSDDLLEVFALTTQDLLKDSKILKIAVMTDPVFLRAFQKDMITSEIILLSINSLLQKFEDDWNDYFMYESICNIMRDSLNANGWKDPELPIKLKKVFETSSLGGTVLWVKILHFAPSDLFDDLDSLKALLEIFIKGTNNEFESISAFEESFTFWDGQQWGEWEESIDLLDFQNKLINSPHYSNENIQLLLNQLAESIESQESQIEAYNQYKPDEFILFLRGST